MSGVEQMAVQGAGRSGDMSTFTFYIQDDRYNVPTMDIVIAQSEARARVRAMERLLESTHHLGVEVYEGDRLRFSMTTESRHPAASLRN